MRCIFLLLFLSIVSFPSIIAQDILYSEDIGPKKKIAPGQVIAYLAADRHEPALTTLILDGSRSLPQYVSLTYEWAFRPNMLAANFYHFSDSDTPVFLKIARF